MGVDYGSVGGIGIEFTGDMAEILIARGVFSEEDWEDDEYECIELAGFDPETAGNSWSGETYYYIMVEGKTLGEVIKNADAFVKKLNDFGIEATVEDLKVISEYYVY